MSRLIIFSVLGLAALAATGCSSISVFRRQQPAPVMVESAIENPIPGTINEPWIEPMYDTVKVPAQLDPTGMYFRPTHRTVVEIRSEKFQAVQFPPDEGK